MSVTETTTFSTAQACWRAGISFRQIDYWCRLGFLGEEQSWIGSGRHRKFTEDDVQTLRIIHALYAFRGPSAAALREVIPAVVARVRSGDLGMLKLAPALYLDLSEVAAGVSA